MKFAHCVFTTLQTTLGHLTTARKTHDRKHDFAFHKKEGKRISFKIAALTLSSFTGKITFTLAAWPCTPALMRGFFEHYLRCFLYDNFQRGDPMAAHVRASDIRATVCRSFPIQHGINYFSRKVRNKSSTVPMVLAMSNRNAIAFFEKKQRRFSSMASASFTEPRPSM